MADSFFLLFWPNTTLTSIYCKTNLRQISNVLKSQMKESFENEMVGIRQESENKILYLMSQLNSKNCASSDQSLDDNIRKQLRFQEREIERLGALQERLDGRSQECDKLKKVNTFCPCFGLHITIIKTREFSIFLTQCNYILS